MNFNKYILLLSLSTTLFGCAPAMAPALAAHGDYKSR